MLLIRVAYLRGMLDSIEKDAEVNMSDMNSNKERIYLHNVCKFLIFTAKLPDLQP